MIIHIQRLIDLGTGQPGVGGRVFRAIFGGGEALPAHETETIASEEVASGADERRPESAWIELSRSIFP